MTKAVLFLLAVLIIIPVVMLLVTYPVMWAGNRFLLDIGLETAEYWSWFWVTLIFSLVFGGSSASSRKS